MPGIALLVLTLAAAGTAEAQQSNVLPFVTSAERFALFNECQPMDLVIEGLPDDATDIGLTEERLQTLAESRLRAARLYDTDALAPYFYMNVNVAGNGFSIRVTFNKRVRDLVTELTSSAPTWLVASTGTHGDDAGFILQGLSEHLDEFILEYLRVNEAACE